MKDTNVKIDVMAKDVEFLKVEVAEVKQLIKDHVLTESKIWEKVMEYMTKQMDKKADVWVENAFRYGLYTVAGIIILAILGVILLHQPSISLL